MNITGSIPSSEQNLPLAHRKAEIEGQESMKLIDGAGQVAQAAQAAATPPANQQPPPAPVKVEPKAGSTVEVVA